MKTIGKYEVLGELGRGAMGVVYKARHPKINMFVALKTITTSVADNPDLLQRFYREGEALGALQHPNIATIYDMGDEGGLPFIAMEFVDGQTLGEVIARRSPIQLYLKLEYAIQACRALDYAHKRGIIHRDIKPGNVMLSKAGAVKVVDFGIARVLETSHTKSGIIMGTFAYMSPEVYHGEHADARSDIFSFGILLFELICYSKPFPGDSPATFMQSICMQEPKRLRELAPECPTELESVIERMLLKPVSERFQSMEDLLLDLEPICKTLQAECVADLIAQSRELIQREEFSQARELLRQVQKLDFTNVQARALLLKVDAILKKRNARPKVEQFVENGIASLGGGKPDEAMALANSALELDSTFGPAQDLLQKAQEEVARVKLVHEKLQIARQRLAEGLLDDVENLLGPILQQEPAHPQALALQEQVLGERTRRQKLHMLLENMQRARVLWTHQKFDECIDLLTGLQKEFPEEEDIRKLMETAREDRAEQHRQNTLAEVRNLLAARRYSECEEVLSGLQKEFPDDDEIPKLLEAIREDQARQRKIEGLAEARNLLASKCHEESIALLSELGKEFPNDDEIGKLDKIIREDQEKQRRQQGIAEARNLLAARRFDDCYTLLGGLRKEFPEDDTILELIADVREEQARQRKVESLAEVQNLLAARRFEDCNTLLAGLRKEFPDDDEIPKLLEAIREDQARQRKIEGLAEARNLLASKRHEESIALLSELGKEFPNDDEIAKLVKIIREDQEKQRRQQGIAEARNLLAARRYDDCKTLLASLRSEFPNDDEIPKLLEALLEDQTQQRKLARLAEARNLRGSKRYEAAHTLLNGLEKEFAGDEEILKLRQLVQDEWAQERLRKGLTDARELVSSKGYEQSIAVLSELQKEFPAAKEISKLREQVRDEWAEQRMFKGLADARSLLSSKRYQESLTLLSELQKEFPAAKEISKLRELVQDEWAEQRIRKGVADARDLLSSMRYQESIALLTELLKEFPASKEISKLLSTAAQERTEWERQQKMAEARTLLAAQRWEESLALLDSLLAVQPKDSAVLKLKALIHSEREKQAKLERLQREWNILKELTGKEAYPEAISRAELLLRDFPGDGDLLRLLEFAREQQAQRERAFQLRKVLDEVEGHLKANRLREAIVTASLGLESFPQNADLNRLLEQAEARQKREQTRQAIEQRVRSIKIMINREEFSDAIRTAEEALKTLGPDTDVTQLLTSAQVEINAREKKREEDRKLESVRTLLDSGDIEEATLLLGETIKSQNLDPDDPRVRRLSEDIKAAMTAAKSTLDTAAPAPPQQSPTREYAFFEGPPLPPPSSLPESSTKQATVTNASASQELTLSQPIAPPTSPQIAPISVSPAVPQSEPADPFNPSDVSELAAPSQKLPMQSPKPTKRSSPIDSDVVDAPVNVPVGSSPRLRTSIDVPPVAFQAGRKHSPASRWRRPAEIGVALLSLILLVLSIRYLRSPHPSTVARPTLVTPSAPSATQEPERGQGEVAPPEPHPITEGDAGQTALLQREDQLWNRAKMEIDNAQFTQAQRDLGNILELPASGRRKGEARDFLEHVIPRRQQEEQLFTQAQQNLRQNDLSGLQNSIDQFGQVIKLGGPRQAEAQKLLSGAQTSLGRLNTSIANLTADARSDLTRGEYGSARNKVGQIQQMGGDVTSLTGEINQSEQNLFAQLDNSLAQLKQRRDEGALQQLKNLQEKFQKLTESGGPTANNARRDADVTTGAIKELASSVATAASAEAAYQGALAKYMKATDLNSLEASRDDFQSIAKGGGAHAGDAQRLLAEINSKIVPFEAEPPDDKLAVRAAVQDYSAAFEKRDAEALRKIWPFMSNEEYERYRKSFSMAVAIHMNWSNTKIEVAPDHATATVTTDVAQNYTPNGSKKAMNRTDHSVFHLVKQNGTWLIKDVQ